MVVAAGVGAVLYVHAAQAPDREQLDRIQEDIDYVTRAAAGHTLYTPEPWVTDLTTYPGFTTTAPEGGVTSSGYLDGKWLIVSQFDADALTAADKDVSATPQTLCKPTGPSGTDSSFKALSGDRVRIRTVCLDVPGHPARVRVVVYLDDGDAMADLATTLPEDGRVLNAGHYEKDPAAVGELVADPTDWAGEVLDSLSVLDPSQYAAEDIYSAEEAAGRFD
ncbi:hypothetical protein ACT8ZV_05335 [Nocardioides sp. MAHUQ-72]|uniref:hypothetical protein n=1 Tax=unclassified Nocardioides TaxID=2615069 RepID=UPI003624319A